MERERMKEINLPQRGNIVLGEAMFIEQDDGRRIQRWGLN